MSDLIKLMLDKVGFVPKDEQELKQLITSLTEIVEESNGGTKAQMYNTLIQIFTQKNNMEVLADLLRNQKPENAENIKALIETISADTRYQTEVDKADIELEKEMIRQEFSTKRLSIHYVGAISLVVLVGAIVLLALKITIVGLSLLIGSLSTFVGIFLYNKKHSSQADSPIEEIHELEEN